MRLIKGGIFVLIGLFIFITLLSLFIPARIAVTRAEEMHGDPLKIFSQIADLKNWKNWHPVFKTDSVEFKFSSGTTGSVTWISKNKANSITLISTKYPNVKFLVHRDGENDSENIISILPLQESTNWQVQWQSLTKLKWYPWEKFSGIFLEKLTGPGLEDALKSLKARIEKP